MVVSSTCGYQWVKDSGGYVSTVFVSAPSSQYQIQGGTVYKCATGYRFSPTRWLQSNDPQFFHLRGLVNNNCNGTERRQFNR